MPALSKRRPSLSFAAYSPQPVGGSSVIQSIQKGSITLAAGVSNNTKTLDTTVTAANAVLFWNGINTDATTDVYGRAAVRITLTNGTTVTADRDQNSTNAVTVYFTVVEFASGVNSIQYNTVPISASTSGTRAISAVGANAFVMWLGSSMATGGQPYSGIQTSVALTSSTEVTATVGWSSTHTVGFVVVDLDSTIVSAVEQRTDTDTAGSATDTDTITSVTTGLAFIANGGFNTGASITSTGAAYTTRLTNATTVTFTRIGTGTPTRTHYYTVVSLNSSCLAANQVQRPGTIAISAATSNTRTVTSVDTTKAVVNWCGHSATSAAPNTICPRLELTDATTVTATVAASGTTTADFELIEFA